MCAAPVIELLTFALLRQGLPVPAMMVCKTVDSEVAVVQYSREVQQPMRVTAVLGKCPHMHWAGPVNREQGRAVSLQPEGSCTLRAPSVGS